MEPNLQFWEDIYWMFTSKWACEQETPTFQRSGCIR